MSDLIVKIILTVIQALLIICIAPLVIGYIRKVKAFMQSRRGSSVIQPYRDLYKLVRKDSVVSKYTSFVFLAVPLILFSIVVLLSLVIPAFTIIPQDAKDIFLYGF